MIDSIILLVMLAAIIFIIIKTFELVAFAVVYVGELMNHLAAKVKHVGKSMLDKANSALDTVFNVFTLGVYGWVQAWKAKAKKTASLRNASNANAQINHLIQQVKRLEMENKALLEQLNDDSVDTKTGQLFNAPV